MKFYLWRLFKYKILNIYIDGNFQTIGFLFRKRCLRYDIRTHDVFTRGQFWPLGTVVACVCPSAHQSFYPSVTKFVSVITHQPFKLGSPHLVQRCQRPWLRSPLFCGTIDLDRQGQIELRSQNLPHFELVHAITHYILKLQFPNLEQQCIFVLFGSLPILGLIEIALQFNF